MALFEDEENSTGNAITAGKLDLEIDWTEHYNGEEVETQDLTNDPGPVFELGDVKPGDHGEATISLHNYDNPAWVHMAGVLTADDDNGLTEPESEVDGTGGDGEGELADELLARMWYDGTDDDEDGGNNEFDDGEVLIAEGTLRDVMAQVNDGVLLEDQTRTTEDGDGGTCSTSEAWKIDETPSVGDTAGPNDEVEITGVHREDGEVVGVDWESTAAICRAAVKGGPATSTESYGCATRGTDFAPRNTRNSNRTHYEISNVRYHFCENGDNGRGCFPNSTTQYVGFEWELPEEVGNEVQSDSVAFDLKFHAQQCRHTDSSNNPFDST
jgi:hypothetical protein